MNEMPIICKHMKQAGLDCYLKLCADPILYNVYYHVCPFPDPPHLPTHPTHPIYLFLSKQVRNKSQKEKNQETKKKSHKNKNQDK